MTNVKSDHAAIKAFMLQNLAKREWVRGSERSPWPRFLFHYTDIRNAIKILEEGRLLSRNYLEVNQSLQISSGSSKVLQGTEDFIKSCVRFYFRPRTPTQYHVEGIRSQRTLAISQFPDAHCPVPVFLLFDSAQILALEDVLFSDGGLGSQHSRLYSSAKELESLPWEKIYHIGPFDPQLEGDIIRHRMAEVLVPNNINLQALRFIYCRSEAEKETLLHLLPEYLRTRYHSKIFSTLKRNLYFRHHTYLHRIQLSANTSVFQFSPDTRSPGPFHLQVFVNNQCLADEKEFRVAGRHRVIKAPLLLHPNDEVQVTLDGHLAFANSYLGDEILS